MKIVRANDLPIDKMIFLEKDALDTCANYVGRVSGNRVMVETLYRYSKPKTVTMTANEFDEWRIKIEKSSKIEGL